MRSVANNDAHAPVQRPRGRTHFRVHSARSDLRLLAELNGVSVLRRVSVHQPGSVLPRGLVVDSVNVGHQNEQIGVDVRRQESRQAVIVPDGDPLFAGVLLLDEHRRRNGVVGVDDRDDVQADQLRQRAEEVFARVLVVEVGLRDQNLSDFDAILGEHRVVQRHQSRLTDGRGRSRLEQSVCILRTRIFNFFAIENA